MEVICLQDEAFYAMIERVIDRIKEKTSVKSDKWISGEEAMRILRITWKFYTFLSCQVYVLQLNLLDLSAKK